MNADLRRRQKHRVVREGLTGPRGRWGEDLLYCAPGRGCWAAFSPPLFSLVSKEG